MTGAPPGAIGSDTWPGLSKVVEECGELMQAAGKLLAFPDGEHADGTNVIERVLGESADAVAAIQYMMGSSPQLADKSADWANRRAGKLERFHRWHRRERGED